MSKKLKTSSAVLLVLLLVGLFLWRFNHKVELLPPNNQGVAIASVWFLSANDGIGEALLKLYENKNFELFSVVEPEELRYGSWEKENAELVLIFKDQRAAYRLEDNGQYAGVEVLDPYRLKFKINKKQNAEYLNFFNYFFYKQ